MFKVSASISVHNASDNSGFLVYVPKEGKAIALAFVVGEILVELSNKESITKDSFIDNLKILDEQEINKLWYSLIAEGIVLEVA